MHEATRIANREASRLLALLERFRPLEAVVETSPAWPWLYDLLTGHGHGFVLAHAKKLRAIAESNYKRDEIDAELVARMRRPGSSPRCTPRTSRRASRRPSSVTAHGSCACAPAPPAASTPSSTASAST